MAVCQRLQPSRPLRQILHQTQCTINPVHRRALGIAAAATATTPAPPPFDVTSASPIQRHPPTQPPSHKPPELRKTQLHRSYQSLIHTSPVLLLFQHNNLKAPEWAGLRRELASALRSVPTPEGTPSIDFGEAVKLHVIQTSVFAAALRVVEFHQPPPAPQTDGVPPSAQHNAKLAHGLSEAAYRSSMRPGGRLPRHTALDSMLSGPMAVLSFPAVTPAHLAAALRILAPTPGAASAFPAPKRRAAPGYYEPAVQNGLQKLLLLGARVEGRAFDQAGVRWVGAIQGGVDGLRAQLVHTLQSAGMGLASALQSATGSLWATMESRRLDMEDQSGEKTDKTEGQ